MTMIDLVIKSICSELERQNEKSGDYVDFADIEDSTLDGRFNLRMIARAAIEAMQEPTIYMLSSGHLEGDADPEKKGWPENFDLHDAYKAMILAALNEAPPADPTRRG